MGSFQTYGMIFLSNKKPIGQQQKKHQKHPLVNTWVVDSQT